MKKKLKKNKGILFWVTGISGSGKTTIAKKLKKRISKLYGPTIVISGDDLRKIFKLHGYKKQDRIENARKFAKLCKFITNQKINIIFAVVGMFEKIRNIFKKEIANFFLIYIKSDINKIIKMKRKKMYFKYKNDIVGIDIKPEFPKKTDITVKNYLNRDIDDIKKEIENTIIKLIN